MNITVLKNPNTIESFLASLDPDIYYGVDIETFATAEPVIGDPDSKEALDYKKSSIRLLQITADGEDATICDFGPRGANHKFNPLLLPKKWIAHNASFELSFFLGLIPGQKLNSVAHCTIELYRLWLQTKVSYFSIFQEGLTVVYAHLFGEKRPLEFDKSFQTIDWGTEILSQEAYNYAALDAIATYRIFHKIYPDFVKLEMELPVELNSRVMEAVIDMSMNGIAMDYHKHEILMNSWKEDEYDTGIKCFEYINKDLKLELLTHKIEDQIIFNKRVKPPEAGYLNKYIYVIESEIKTAADLYEFLLYLKEYKEKYKGQRSKDPKYLANTKVLKICDELYISHKSNKQLSQYLQEVVPPTLLKQLPRTDKSKELQINADTLSEFDLTPYVGPLAKFKGYAKMQSTYGEGLKEHFKLNGNIAFIHPRFTLCKTATNRMSSFSPNSQVSPREEKYRQLFIPRSKDFKLLVADFSQIELRVAAHISNDKVLLEAFRTGQDVHRITASNVLNKHIDDVTKEDRQLAKAVNFGLIYGAGPDTLINYAKNSYDVTLDYDQAKEIIYKFRKLYAGLRKWHMDEAARAEDELYTTSELGKKTVLESGKTYTTAANFPIQGTSAEITKIAVLKIYQATKGIYNAVLCNVVHDEVVVDCHKDDIMPVARIIKKSMEDSMLYVFPTASLNGLADVTLCNNWFDSKSDKNIIPL